MSSNAAIQKLVNVMGPARAGELATQVLRQIGLQELRTPDDRLRFGQALIGRGGLLESIGRSIKMQAILHGAREEQGAPGDQRAG